MNNNINCTRVCIGYNLGTTAPKPYKQVIKSYQNDTILTRKTMKSMIYIEPEKEFE